MKKTRLKIFSALLTFTFILTSFSSSGFSQDLPQAPAQISQQNVMTPEQAAALPSPPPAPLMISEIAGPLSKAENLTRDTVVLTLDGLNNSPHNFDETQTVYPLQVTINLNQNEGTLTSSNGKTGQYKFYAIKNTRDETQFILKVAMDAYDNETGFRETSYFMVNTSRTTFQFFGSSNQPSGTDIDTSKQVWTTLAKFYEDPLSLSSDEYSNLKTLFTDKTDTTFHGTAVETTSSAAAYAHRLLDALSASPGFNFSSDTDYFPYYFFSIAISNMESGVSQKIIEHLKASWDFLSTDVKINLLKNFQTGNSQSLNIAGGLFLNLSQQFSHPYQWGALFQSLSPTITAVLKDIGLAASTREKILDFLFSKIFVIPGYVSYDNALLDFQEYLKNPFFRNSPLTGQRINQYINSLLAVITPASHSYVFESLLENFSDYLLPSAAPAIETFINYAMTQYDGTYPLAKSLLVGLKSPLISVQKKTEIETLLRAKGFKQWATTMSGPYVDQSLSDASLSQLSNELGGAIVDGLTQNPTPDLWLSASFFPIQSFLEIFGKNPNWGNYVSVLLPVLNIFNPKQSAETPEQYAERLNRVRVLFLQNHILLSDPDGATFSIPGYFDALIDYSYNHPDWIHAIALTQQNFVSKATTSVAAIAWKGFDTPEKLAAVLVHESTHSIIEFHDYSWTQDLKAIIPHWYYAFPKNSASFATLYSTTNPREYIADTVEEWSRDSKMWLHKAFTEYGEGNPALLNLFIAIWGIQPLVPDPGPGFRYFSRINQETGFTEKEKVPANWTGNMLQGTFNFQMDGTTYQITYKNYIISDVRAVNPAADHLLNSLEKNPDQLSGYNLLFNQTISNSQASLTAAQRELMAQVIVSAPNYTETTFLKSLPPAKKLLEELRSPDHAADLQNYNDFEAKAYLPASGPLALNTAQSLITLVSAPEYNHDTFFTTLAAARALSLRFLVSSLYRIALAALSYDPNGTSGNYSLSFLYSSIFELAVWGDTGPEILNTVIMASDLLKTLRLPANADKLALFQTIYNLPSAGNTIPPAWLKVLTDTVAAPGYNRENFILQLPSESLLIQLRAAPEKLSAFNKLYGQAIAPKGTLTDAQRSLLMTIVYSRNYDPASFLSHLIPAYTLFTTVISKDNSKQAFNALFGTTLGTAISSPKPEIFLDLVGDPGYNITTFISSLPKARDLFAATTSAPEKKAAFNSLYGLGLLNSGGLNNAAQRILIFSLAASSNFNATQMVTRWVSAASLLTTLRKNTNAAKLAAFNRIYGTSLILTGAPSAADLQKLMSIISAAGYDEKKFLDALR